MEIFRAGETPSREGPTGWFTGRVRIDGLFNPAAPDRVQGAHVTFEPGARTAWHTHPLGQTLIVTSGVGRAQREGGPVEEIRPGDVRLVRTRREALARRLAGDRHDPHCHPGSRRRQGRRLDGTRQRRRLRRLTRQKGTEHARNRPACSRRRPLRGCRRAEDREADRRDHQARRPPASAGRTSGPTAGCSRSTARCTWATNTAAWWSRSAPT